MADKLTIVRLRNLAAALRSATEAADRLDTNDPNVVDPTLVDRLEEMEMEVGMVLADLEDGSRVV